jgi:hypothetical protein
VAADRADRNREELHQEVRSRREVVHRADHPVGRNRGAVLRVERSRVADHRPEARREDRNPEADHQEMEHQDLDRQGEDHREDRSRDLDRQGEDRRVRRAVCHREVPSHHREANRAEGHRQAGRTRREVDRQAEDRNLRRREVRPEADPNRRPEGHHHQAGNRRRPLRARSRSALGTGLLLGCPTQARPPAPRDPHKPDGQKGGFYRLFTEPHAAVPLLRGARPRPSRGPNPAGPARRTEHRRSDYLLKRTRPKREPRWKLPWPKMGDQAAPPLFSIA